MNENYTFESFRNITAELTAEIRELGKLCNGNDNTHYQLFLENTLNADRAIDFLYLCRFEGKIVSMVLLFFPDLNDIELYGYTHPDHRRNGLFSSLIDSARKTLKKYDSWFFLFVCDQDSIDGKNFLEKLNTNLEEIEYMMELNRDLFDLYMRDGKSVNGSIRMEHATMDQLEDISIIACSVYGEDNHKSSDFVRQTILSEKREQMIGIENGRIVGICTVGIEDGFVMISGMGIDPAYQGKGLGRELLNQVIGYVKGEYECPLKLEVSSKNDRAYNLYKSVGFKQNESYGYYRLNNTFLHKK